VGVGVGFFVLFFLCIALRLGATNGPVLPSTSHVPAPYSGPSLDEVHAARERYLNPALAPFLLYKKPIMVTQGKMQYVWDDQGKRYLDAFGGIVTVSVGHAHPKVLEAGIEQMKKVQHLSVIYHNPEIAMFAKELAAKFEHLPNDLSVVYFTNSGSEANDLALLMARMHTGNHDMLALRNGYHGMSYTAMGLTALNTWKFPVPQGECIRHVQNPNVYRGKFGPNDNPGLNYSDDVLDVIRHCTPGGVAGYISESIQVCRVVGVWVGVGVCM
jgi:alanine-glyoxylate transaminase / (R)-3-amino-2-methylpropionate-pyruvate transaminase